MARMFLPRERVAELRLLFHFAKGRIFTILIQERGNYVGSSHPEVTRNKLCQNICVSVCVCVCSSVRLLYEAKEKSISIFACI